MADAGIPLYTWSIHPAEATGQESIFGYAGVICTTCTGRAVPYAGELVDADDGRDPRLRRIARTRRTAPPARRRLVELYGDDTGLEVGYINDDLAFGLPNGIGPEVTAMKDAGVDFIVGCLDLNGMKTLAQELERQGMGDVPMYHPNTYDAGVRRRGGRPVRGRPRRASASGRSRPTPATASSATSRSGWRRPAARSPRSP